MVIAFRRCPCPGNLGFRKLTFQNGRPIAHQMSCKELGCWYSGLSHDQQPSIFIMGPGERFFILMDETNVTSCAGAIALLSYHSVNVLDPHQKLWDAFVAAASRQMEAMGKPGRLHVAWNIGRSGFEELHISLLLQTISVVHHTLPHLNDFSFLLWNCRVKELVLLSTILSPAKSDC